MATEYAVPKSLSTYFGGRFGTVLSILSASLVFMSDISLWASPRSQAILESLLETDASHGSLCGPALAANDVRARVTALADEVRARIDSELEKGTPSADEIVRATNAIIFGPHGLRSSADLKAPCNLLISGVLARGQGYCVGLAGVYLSVAEQLDLPIDAVATPSHVFLRYDDGATRINIETMNGGAAISDEQYIAQQRIAESSVRKGVFLRALSRKQFLAQVHNNLGVIDSERKDYEAADAEYARALSLDPRLPAAWYNRGKQYLELAELERAIHDFSKALRLHPNDTWALNNRGLAYRGLEDEPKARADFEAALRIDPAFEPAKSSLKTKDK